MSNVLTKYQRQLFRTKNIETGKETYFMMVCDVPRRISKADYDEYKSSADSTDSLSTESTKTHIRHYTTCNYYM